MVFGLRLHVFLVFILMSTALLGQIIESDAEINPEFVSWLDNINQQQENSGGFGLGYRPHPVIINTELKLNDHIRFSRDFAPSSYDLRSLGLLTSVKNQGGCGACWTFAAMASVESNWLKNGIGTYDLSEDNLNTCHVPFLWSPCEGGNAEISSAYFMRGSGPFSEADDPYDASHINVDCPSGLTPQGFVTAAWFLPTNDNDIIKNCIMQYGALASNMYWDPSCYNSSNYTYYYSGASNTNHGVTLVGWDDTKVTAGGTGAWIIRNSWGAAWGENGYFYVSYQDTKVNSSLTVFPDYTEYSSGAEVLSYSDAGWLGQIGYGTTNTVDALVKFIASDNIQLSKIGTAAVQSGSIISVEIYDSFNGSNSLTGLLASISPQSCNYAGYYTFDLPTPIEINNGDDFFVKFNYSTTENSHPVPIERVVDGYCNPDISSGIFWMKTVSASSWTPVENYFLYDPCVYVYTTPTSDIEYDLELSALDYLDGTDNCENALNNITVAAANSVTVQSGASVTFIAGHSIRFLPGFHAYNNSYVSAYITTTGSFCDDLPAPIVAAPPIVEKSYEFVEPDAETNNFVEQSMVVYPNPNNGQFTIAFTNFEGTSQVFLFNAMGQKVYAATVNEQQHWVELPNLQRGIYFVKAINQQKQFDVKIVVQ